MGLIAEESLRARFGRNIIDHYTYVIAGDGCLMEGVSQEAISLAGHLNLNKLIVFWDNNNITIDGPVNLADSTNQKIRFEASGWSVIEIDGHDPEAINTAILAAKSSQKPTMIACKTHIAIGNTALDTSKGHGALTDPELIKVQDKFTNDRGHLISQNQLKSSGRSRRNGDKTFISWQSKVENLSSAQSLNLIGFFRDAQKN